MQTLRRALGLAVPLAVALSTVALAQGWIDPVRPVLPTIPMGRIERIRSAVQVSVSGRVARVTVEEWFRNTGPAMAEGVYHFPLPGEAVFSSYSLWQGDQELRGETMDAAQARAIYENIVRIKRSGDHLEVTLDDTAPGGDFELFFPLARGLVGLSLVTDHPAGEDGYFMLLLAPGAAAQTEALRRDVAAVIDVSGSMSGEKLNQAKAALIQLLGTLREQDRFRLVAFSGAVRRYATGWTAATAENRRDATAWIRSLEAEGGTNIAGALAEALTDAPAEEALGVVVFLTDGLPTAGDTDPERIAERAEQGRGRFRLFAFGVGDDVNTFLLDRLTERARGTTEYVRPGQDIERAVGTLAAKVASPVLTDLTLVAGQGVELYDVQPGNLPDLFAGDELVVFGRYRGAGSGERSVTVRGRRNGRQEQFSTVLTDREGVAARYIEQLWAARKAGALSREIRLHGQTSELIEALKQLALRHGILTEYTAYLVQEPTVVARQREEQRVLQAPAPAPRDQAGSGAVAKAVREGAMSSAVHLDGIVVTGVWEAARSNSGVATQRVGGRLFTLRDSTWTDLGHGDSLRLVTVAPYSDAYFALLRAVPELVAVAALEPAVLVAGKRASIKIGKGGKEAWMPGELERLVREFRG